MARDGMRIAHVADVELQLAVVVELPHVVLLLLVAGEDADFTDVGVEEAAEDGVAEGAGTAGDQECFVTKKSLLARNPNYQINLSQQNCELYSQRPALYMIASAISRSNA
jgi:hypothetical protein